MNSINIIFFITISIFIILSFYKKFDIEEKYSIQNNVFILIAIFLTAVIIFTRIYSFNELPEGINQDEAMAGVDGYALSKYAADRYGMKMPVYFTAWTFAQMNVLESYLMIPFMKILGLNELSTRLPMLIVNLISVPVLYLFCKNIINRNFALCVLFFLSVNPWHFMTSRWGLESNIFPHFILFSVYFLQKGLKNSKYLYLSMIFFGITLYAYGIAYYTIPPMLIIFCTYMYRHKLVSTKQICFCVLSYLTVALPIFIMMFINLFKLPSIELPFLTIPYFEHSVRNNDLLPFADNILMTAILNIKHMIDIVFLQKKDNPWNTIKEFGTYYLFSFPILILGIICFFRNFKLSDNKEKKTSTFFVIVWFLIALFSGFIAKNVNVNRINIVYYPIIIFCAYAIYLLIFKANLNKLCKSFVVAIYLFSFTMFSLRYFGDYKKELSPYFYVGFKEAVLIAENSDYAKKCISTNTQYKGSTEVSRILTLFYTEMDPLYFQNKLSIYDENHNKLLPFVERYVFKTFDDIQYPEKDTVYVINSDESHLFPGEYFSIIEFENYAVAFPK